MYFKIFLLNSMYIFIMTVAHAQQISGLIKDEFGIILHGASVVMKKAKDSSVVKVSATNISGEYQFNNVPEGNYFITGSFAGRIPFGSGVFEVHNKAAIHVPDIRLLKNNRHLANVIVSASRPLVEVTMDKIVINVEGTINSVGQDGWDLLRKAPGVEIVQDENLSMNGKNGVQIYIDGRRTPLSGSDLAAYLKSIPSTSIEAIEIIGNPSAKYEAAGNAGIINIRLIKNKSYGTNGSLSGGYNIGVFSKYNGSLALNHRNTHLNLFGNFTHNQGINRNNGESVRNTSDTFFNQNYTGIFHFNNQVYKAGIDYFISKRSVTGIMINGNISNTTGAGHNDVLISYLPSNQPVRRLISGNNTSNRRVNRNLNFNYRYADSSRREWNMDIDHGYFHAERDQMQPNVYYDPTGTTVLYSRDYTMLTPVTINIYTFKSDYEQDFNKGRLGFGIKLAFIESQNNLEQYLVQQTVKIPDTSHTNAFLYRENINALYINYNKAFKKLKVQIGLRMENTNIRGYSDGFKRKDNAYVAFDSVFNRSFTNLFPNIGLSFPANAHNQWQVILGRRIDRPDYENMNPFEYRSNEYSFQRGNTGLRPQFTSNLSVTHSYKSKLINKITYSYVNDAFSAVFDTLEKSKSFQSIRNLSTQRIINLGTTYTLQYKWYTFFTSLNGNHIRLKAGFNAGKKVNLSVFTWSVSQQHTFKLDKEWSIEIYARYSSPGLWGLNRNSANYFADAGLQKKLFAGKMNIKASVSDMFNSINYSIITDAGGDQSTRRRIPETRQFKLGIVYSIGSSQVKAVRQRSTGVEEESKRADN